MSLQDRRKRRLGRIAVAAALVLLVLLVAIVLGVTLSQKKSEKETFKKTFMDRCNQSKGNNCENLWSKFEQAYVRKDPCKVPPDAYGPLFELAPIIIPDSKALFWSQTKDVAHGYTSRNKDCFVTMENTLLGLVLDGLVWCGKDGSDETFTEGCPGWLTCENNTVRSFWFKGSASFAEAASGGATVMLSGSINAPFNASSIFGSVEVPRLAHPRVGNLTVVLVTPENPRSNCSHKSFEELRRLLKSGISYECKDVKQSHIEQCSSKADACKTCW